MRVSQADFARKMKKSRQLVNRWLNDPTHPPEEDSLDQISKISGISKVWIRYGEGDPYSTGPVTPTYDPVVLRTALLDIQSTINKVLGIEAPTSRDEGVIDVSPDIMAVLSDDERFMRAGRQWAHALGWERKDIEGKRWDEILHPGDLNNARLAFKISKDDDAIVEFDGRARNNEGEFQSIRWRVTRDGERFIAAGRETNEPQKGLQVIARGEK